MSSTTYEPERFRSLEYLAVLDQKIAEVSFHIPSLCMERMRSSAESGYPHEICGLLIGTLTDTGWQVHDVRDVANLNEERATDRFQLDPVGYQKVDRELRGSGSEIIGVYHSHPDCPAKPSPTDLASAWESFAYPIISVCDGKAIDIHCWAVNASASAFQNIEIKEHTS